MKKIFFLFFIYIFFVAGCSSHTSSKSNEIKTTNDSNKQEQAKKENSNYIYSVYGNFQMTDEFSSIIEKNPIDLSYEQELHQLSNSHYTTQGHVELEGKYVEIWDKELNEVYKKLLTKLNDKEKKILEESQKNWLSYHEKEEEFVWEVFYSRQEGPIFGTQGRVQITAAYKSRLRERTLQLIEYYYILSREIEFRYKQ